jgi:hypothetical protein
MVNEISRGTRKVVRILVLIIIKNMFIIWPLATAITNMFFLLKKMWFEKWRKEKRREEHMLLTCPESLITLHMPCFYDAIMLEKRNVRWQHSAFDIVFFYIKKNLRTKERGRGRGYKLVDIILRQKIRDNKNIQDINLYIF